MLSVDTPLGTAVAVAVLVAVILAAVSPGGLRLLPRLPALPVAAVAIPAAGLLLILGLVRPQDAWDEFLFMAPTIGFLAAMLVVAEVCARSGVFRWVGDVMVRLSAGSPSTLLRVVFVAAALTTATLSLDTTVLLLTPVVIAAAWLVGPTHKGTTADRGTGTDKASAYASVHLANSASTLLPVSNLTNLLAFSATGLSFLHFTGLMAAPWLAAILVEYLVIRWFFARSSPRDTTDQPGARATPDQAQPAPAPVTTLTLLALLLVGFIVAEPLGIPLVAVAAVGALAMSLPLLLRNPAPSVIAFGKSINLPFLGFVAALGIIVLPVRSGPLGNAVANLIPEGNGLLALAGMAALAAIAANVLNNLPATLLLIPLIAEDPVPDQPLLVLAMLLGVNIGPNLTYFGSLANLLWRDVMRRNSVATPTREFVLLGALSVPLTLAAAVLALWVSSLWLGSL